MTSTAAQRPVSRRRAAVWITIGILVAVVILFFIFAGLYTDWLWYQQLGYLSVLTTQWFAATALFFIGFLGMALPLWLSVQFAYQLRPVYAKLNAQLDRYQQVIEPLRRLAMYGIPIVFGLFAGVSAASRWQTVLLWLNRTPSGTTDPVFHLDDSFYLFELPFYRGVVGFASAVVIIALIATLATTYLYGSVRITGREVRISRAARVQIAVVAALYLLLQAASVWLDRFATLTDSNLSGMVNGATYTDVNATIPGRTILAGIAVVVALLFLVTAVVGHWRWPLVGTLLLLVSALLIVSIYPWVVQRFQVAPSEKTLELPYIKRAIDGTRQAYGLSGVQESTYNAKTTAEPGALRQDAETTANIRIIDPAEVSPAFAQLQQFKQYYGFASVLDVDRYKIDGKEQDTVIAVRELEQSGLASARNWYNDTLVYTHGYGIVAAYGNQRSSDGQPVFLESGIPVTGKLGSYQPRVYFGEKSPTYSIVGGSKNGSGGVELDYPAGNNSTQQTFTTFSGNGGPKLDNVFNRLVYALKFQDEQILLSSSVNKNSQILYDRNPLQRVQKVAPYLTLDSDPYPAVVDGRIQWIIDGYTTSNAYPYSQINSLSHTIADTQTPKQPYAMDGINYIRNSVKATVDAYSGKVTLYAWDTTDPILKTWQKIFPSTVKPMKDMSSALLSHVRYPADMFKVQRAVLGQYHVTDPGSFYSQDDAWITPDDPVSPAGSTTLQPPYYLTMQMPGQTKPSFSLYSTYIPQATTASSRSVLKGYLAVDADAGSTPGKVAAGYGKLRLLNLPSEDNVPGPGQVQNTFGSDPNVSQQLNVLRLGKTDVISGNLLTLPVGGGLLYVQPVYVKSTGETSYPLLQKVLVAFGDKIAFKDTLDSALDVLFGGDSGASAGDTNVSGTTPPATGGTGSTTTTPTTNAALQQALKDAKTAMLARNAAMQAGNWAAYGVADQQLTAALNAAIAAESGTSTSK